MATLKEILEKDSEFGIYTGFSRNAQSHKRNDLFRQVAKAMLRSGIDSRDEVYPLWVPSRIEVLGKHTDYAGGTSIVAALQKGFAFIAHANNSRHIHVLDAGSQQRVQVDIETLSCKASYPWSVYVKTVIDRVRVNFGKLDHGISIGMVSNIPTASGMSSSSALVSGLFLVLCQLYNLQQREEYQANIGSSLDLADYIGYIENGQTFKGLEGAKGVGTFGGSQDHVAILCSKPEKLRQFSFRPTRFVDEVSLPEGYCFVIACSGVRAEKTRAARDLYNRCALLVSEILQCEAVNPDMHYQTLGQLVGASRYSFIDAKASLLKCSEEVELSDRLFQFEQEVKHIIPSVMDALKSKAYEKVGELVDRSQQLANTHLKNQVKETNYLARTARSLGAMASSAFGAGFGGSVWALVKASESDTFVHAWQSDYTQHFPEWQSAEFFVDATGTGVFDLSLSE